MARHPVWVVAARDLRRRSRDPVGLLLWAAIPLAVALLVRLAFGSDEANRLRPARVALADLDSTLVSQLVLGAFSQGPAQDLFAPVRADSAEAVSLARRGKVSAAVIIPRGFADRYLAGEEARLVLYENPEERVLPRIVEESTHILADGAFYLRLVLEQPFDRIKAEIDAGASPSDASVAEVAVQIRRQIEALRSFLFPPVLRVEMKTRAHAGMAGNYFFLLFPGLLLTASIFVSQALAQDVWVEQRRGTLRRNLASGHSIAMLLLGKVLAGMVVLAGIFGAVLVVGSLLLHIELRHVPAAVGFGLASAFAILAFLHLVIGIARTENAATMLTSLIIMPSILLGGAFFPIESLPNGLQFVARHTPTGWMREVLRITFLGEATAAGAWWGALVCLAAGAACLFVAGKTARGRFGEA